MTGHQRFTSVTLTVQKFWPDCIALLLTMDMFRVRCFSAVIKDLKTEQCINIFLQLGKNHHWNTWNGTNTCGDKALSSTQTFLWIQCFQEEEEDVEHDRNSGWQTTFNSEMAGKVHNLLAREQRMTSRMKPSELNFSKEFVWSVITKNSIRNRTVWRYDD